METPVLPTKRKVIDLKGDTFRSLSLMAASKGTNLLTSSLKKYVYYN